VWRSAVPQIYANVNKDQVLKQGVNLTDVYTTLQANLGGFYTNQFNRFGRQWKVFLQAEPEYRTKQEDIGQFHVRNKMGGMVPLGALMSTDKMVGPQNTDRHNLYRAVELNVAVKPGFSTGQAIAALEAVAKENLPPEMSYDYNGMTYQEKKAGGSAAIFAMSFTFVFLILAAMYESWTLPFSVLLTAPLAMLGAYLGLFGRGFDNNVYAQIGLIMLIGLAAKNAILIVEFAKIESDKGRDLVEAALDGARLRLRPILMTSFAFILGCVPLAIASGAGAAGRQIMGTAVIMGMVVVTGLGIFLVPVLYVVLERMIKKKPVAADAKPTPDAAHGGH
jgi:HAE1 family hydrophobic/amphiphilic exporter-1